MDQIAKNIKLPKDIELGDWFVLGGMGSYTYGPRSQFNGMESCDRIEVWNEELSNEVELPKEK
jgi:diaminopimelate decarboxylase